MRLEIELSPAKFVGTLVVLWLGKKAAQVLFWEMDRRVEESERRD